MCHRRTVLSIDDERRKLFCERNGSAEHTKSSLMWSHLAPAQIEHIRIVTLKFANRLRRKDGQDANRRFRQLRLRQVGLGLLAPQTWSGRRRGRCGGSSAASSDRGRVGCAWRSGAAVGRRARLRVERSLACFGRREDFPDWSRPGQPVRKHVDKRGTHRAQRRRHRQSRGTCRPQRT